MPHAKRTQSLVSTAGERAPSVWGRVTPEVELRVYRWFRKGNRVIAGAGTIAIGGCAIGGYTDGLVISVVLVVLLLPVGLLLELCLRPRGGGKPVMVRQAALDKKAAARSAKIFRRGSAVPRRTDYLAATQASRDPFVARPEIVYQRACSSIRWDGNALIIGGRGGIWPVSSDGVESDFLPPAMGSRKNPATAPSPDAPVAAPVVVAFALLKPASRPIGLLVLLDRSSRQLGAVGVRGFTESAIRDVARKAGVELSVYELPARFGHSQESVAAAMFPRSVLYR